ncbi:MAG TPA: radical SAM protein [Candidatus Scalindua sp.]|nr:radical SAM protein [Candidatus Scalindua sp.]
MIKRLRRGTTLSIFPSFVCNYGCEYCLLQTGKVYPKSETKSFNEWKDFLNELDIALRNSCRRGIKEILLVGGEPTLLPYFVDLCHWILFEKRWQLVIFTNLSNLKMMEVKPSLLLRIEATYHQGVDHDSFYLRYKKVNRLHRVIPRQLSDGPRLSYMHKGLTLAEEKDRDNFCPPFLRISPDQTINLTYGKLCQRKTN